VCAWDGDLTYGELDALSSALAEHLAERGVGPEVFVPLCFEKSRWTIVAMVGVMKAGGMFVLLDPSHPAARLRGICRDVSATLIMASTSLGSKINYSLVYCNLNSLGI
jgi:non-ribosomal peptide synthetase component F